jgi:hypothetical protein
LLSNTTTSLAFTTTTVFDDVQRSSDDRARKR